MNLGSKLRPLRIKGKTIPIPIIQGGMGVGVSLHPLAKAVAREGGLGIVASACLERLVSKRSGRKVNSYEAAYEEMCLSKAEGGFAGINIMVAVTRYYADTVRGAIDAGADAIISGAGLPLTLPAIQNPKDTALIPCVSSARALSIICKRWSKSRCQPDAVVLEGPLAGGHLGFKFDEVELESNRLENLLPAVKEVAMKNGDFPVVVAGGVYTHEDIVKFMGMGASGVQMATRFLATHESSATRAYKQAGIDARAEDILVADRPGSPCGLPFRVIRQAPMYVSALKRLRQPRCDKGYLLMKDAQGSYTQCPAKNSNDESFCICNGLLSAAGCCPEEEPIYTVGTNAARVDRITSVSELMAELTVAPPRPKEWVPERAAAQ